jgi:hypothetical protein
MTTVNLIARVKSAPAQQAAPMAAVGTNDSLSLVGGDDWIFAFTVQNADGSATDLTGATISWTLLDENGYQVVAATDSTITVTDAVNGLCQVEVAGSVTTKFPRNSFQQALRVIEASGATTTPYVGVIWVTPDPWQVRTSQVNWESGLVPPGRKELRQ